MEKDKKAELAQTSRYIRFGPFHVDRQRRQVTRSGVKLRLQGKVYQVLLALITKHGQTVTREELKQVLWAPDVHVNFDANVNTTVNRLRQVLGDSVEKPVYIETIPRNGYTFLLEPEFSAEPFAQTRFSASEGSSSDEDGEPAQNRARWATLGVVALILAAMLLGAAIALFWISNFVPAPYIKRKLRSDCSRDAPAVPSRSALGLRSDLVPEN